MPRGRRLLPDAVRDKFKYEIAEELGIRDEIDQKGWGDMPTRQLGRIGGKIGGNMVKVMIRQAEQSLAQESQIEDKASTPKLFPLGPYAIHEADPRSVGRSPFLGIARGIPNR